METLITDILTVIGAVLSAVYATMQMNKANAKKQAKEKEDLVSDILNKYENKFIALEKEIEYKTEKFTNEVRNIKAEITAIKTMDCKIDDINKAIQAFQVNINSQLSDIKADIKIINNQKSGSK